MGRGRGDCLQEEQGKGTGHGEIRPGREGQPRALTVTLSSFWGMPFWILPGGQSQQVNQNLVNGSEMSPEGRA